jgi:hypothetical protein
MKIELGCSTRATTCENTLDADIARRVDLFEALTHLSPKVRRLLGMADAWKRAQRGGVTAVQAEPFQPQQPEALAVRLGADGVALLIERYRNGQTARELAAYFGCSLSTVKRLLRQRDVRRRSPGGRPNETYGNSGLTGCTGAIRNSDLASAVSPPVWGLRPTGPQIAPTECTRRPKKLSGEQ